MLRLESLRDLDYQSWQLVADRTGPPAAAAPITLRIVGYPGRVRLDHPTPLEVRSGRRRWRTRAVGHQLPALVIEVPQTLKAAHHTGARTGLVGGTAQRPPRRRRRAQQHDQQQQGNQERSGHGGGDRGRHRLSER
ncbi:MAG: DUF3122 domain-containing protein [Prochlorococcaceae cyanobacterium]